MASKFKIGILGIVIILALIIVAGRFPSRPSIEEIPFNSFLNAVKEYRVSQVDVHGARVEGSYKDGNKFVTIGPIDFPLLTLLTERQVNIFMHDDASHSGWLDDVLRLAPWALLAVIAVMQAREIRGGKHSAFSFGKSRAKMQDEISNDITFENVAGCDEAKEELAEIIDFLKDPTRFQKLGGRIPRGVLLIGPPGSGKTLLARAVAGESKVPFFSISGADFVEMFVGVGAARVRDMFEQAKKHAPCIIFVDEIDAVAHHRGDRSDGGDAERDQTLNQLLVEMDGFQGDTGVIVMAATNRVEVLDPALLRPGRFDRKVRLNLPDVRGRQSILNVHIRKIPTDPNVDLAMVAKITPSFSGADLANLVNEAALFAARAGQRTVTMENFNSAVHKIRTVLKKRLLIESDLDKERVAVHEIGHFVVSLYHEGLDSIKSISLYSPYEPETSLIESRESNVIASRKAVHNTLVTLLAGNAAENIFFDNDGSNLGENDLAFANVIAYDMVARWGMHPAGGMLNDDMVRLRELRRRPNASLLFVTDKAVVDAVLETVTTAYQEAVACIELNAGQMREWIDQLMVEERLDSAWVEKIRKRVERKGSRKELPQAESEKNIDFAIITAIEVERKAVCAAFGLTAAHRKNIDSRVYWQGTVEPVRGARSYGLVVAQLSGTANVGAALMAHDILKHWNPQAVIMVGIAAAAVSTPLLGDVVVADAVLYYESGKDTAEGRLQAPTVFQADATLLNRIKALPDWVPRIAQGRPDGSGTLPRVHFGVIASGERVIADEQVRDSIAVLHRKILAIEMEGYGVSNSVWASFKPVRHLVIRAISDQGDINKNDDWQPYAAAVAAEFTRHFILDGPLEPRK
jgi:cell division protease FtsH